MKRPNYSPKISVIMPVYNVGRFLKESIKSILNQTFKDFEFIIINDGSKDNCREIIEKYMKKDKRIILINNQKNMTVQRSLNKGLKIAKGKYIARMDGDDISLPKRLEEQYNYLEKNPSIFLVGTSAIIMDENGEKIGLLLKEENANKNKKRLLKTNILIHPSIMFRNTKEFFYREKFKSSEDYDLYLRIISAGKTITNLETPLVKYRVSRNSFVSTMPYQPYYFNKAKEFYFERKKLGNDDYENLSPPKEAEDKVDFDKLNSRVKILSKFQDNQMKSARKEIGLYIKSYGFDKYLLFYYFLSFFPPKLIKLLRKIF